MENPRQIAAFAQNALANYLLKFERAYINIPNCYIYGECDLLSIKKGGISHEFELKLTRSDYRNDYNAYARVVDPAGHSGRVSKKKRPKYIKHRALANGESTVGKEPVPNYYSFLLPAQLQPELHDIDVPYAGIYTFDSNFLISKVRRPQRIHDGLMTDRKIMHLLRNLHFRYWKLYLSNDE